MSRRRDPRNELQADLHEWGSWIRTRGRIAREFVQGDVPNILARFQPSAGGREKNVRLSARSSEINALVLGMYNDGGRAEKRACALFYAYVNCLKFESCGLEMGLSESGFRRLLEYAESELRHRLSLLFAARRALADAEETAYAD